MDDERKMMGRTLPFGEREPGVIPQPHANGPMIHCMIINYQMIDTTISHERMAVKLAHPQLADLDNGQFFRQSGMTDEGFKQMTLRELYPLSQNGSVQNIKSSPPGCVSFDASPEVFGRIAEVFPPRKFTIYAHKFAQDRDESVITFRRFLQSRLEDDPPEYEHRPYLDA